MELPLDPSVYRRRIEAVRARLEERGLDALYLSSPLSIFYVSGCWMAPTERPITLVVPLRREPFLMAPGLETEHAGVVAPFIADVATYFEYPDTVPPLVHMGRWMAARGLAQARIGYDAPATGVMGYRGPALADVLPGAQFVPAGDLIAGLRLVKQPEEIAYFRESARWGVRAQALLQESLRENEFETVLSMEVSMRVSAEMLAALGPAYAWILGFGHGPAFAIFRGGVDTSFPHPLAFARRLQRGDGCVTGCGAKIGGYNTELERTMFFGEPSREQVRYFELMRVLQEQALGFFAPGRTARDVETDVRRLAEEAGVTKLLRHHTGHGIGLEIHEAPFIDLGDETELQPGMLFSCEPGLYVPGLGGFRHSDTVLITAKGCEVLTRAAPKDLASVVVNP